MKPKYTAKRTSRLAGKPRTYRGKKVEDARETFTFVITRDDCKKGKPNSPGNCAAAISLKRSLPGTPLGVYVHRSFTFVEYKDKVVRYSTPHGLRDQLIRFDSSGKFDTGGYRIKAVPKNVIAARGKQHSPPDRARGDPLSPNARDKAVTLRHHVGRQAFRFDSQNSDFR